MRILILTNHYPPFSHGSYEMQCLQITRGLIGHNHSVRVLCGKPPPDQRRQASGEANHIVFRELDFYPDHGAPASRFVSLYRLNHTDTQTLQQHLRDFHPEVIMIWGVSGLPLSVLLEADRSNVPCVYAVCDHWLGEQAGRDPWFNYWTDDDDITEPHLVRNLVRRLHLEGAIHSRAPYGDVRDLNFEHISFCSESLKSETIRRTGFDLGHAKVIPCAIVPSEIRPRTGQQLSPRRLMYVARLSEDKDPYTAIKALLELRKRGHEDYTLDIYGRGDSAFEAGLHDYVRRYQLGGAVSFKPMDAEQVRDSLHLYDTLLFTSKYAEPFPLIHLKAMAARVPVISTLEGGAAELIRDGENGIAFRTADATDLADKIIALSEDLETRERITEGAYNEAVSRYSLKQIIPRFETMLNEAVARKTPGQVVA